MKRDIKTNRGQVGIGTLIVFIAMVLVAAIAAGVLINTAGLLQTQGEATGEETSQQVTDRVQVSTVTGTAGNESDALVAGEIDRITLITFKGSGAGEIDLTNVIIEVFANGESGSLTHVGGQSNTDFDGSTLNDPDDFTLGYGYNVFGIINIQGVTDGTLENSSDRAKLVFDLTDIRSGTVIESTLAAGDTVTIRITTVDGATTFIEKSAPSSIKNGETYRL